eukprot:m.125391 g.125391  ORF g.125391 m.125391 type:complete len:179 (+) comp9427_c2_seq1:860-1396(+)
MRLIGSQLSTDMKFFFNPQPPNSCDAQPMERLWAVVKQEVALRQQTACDEPSIGLEKCTSTATGMMMEKFDKTKNNKGKRSNNRCDEKINKLEILHNHLKEEFQKIQDDKGRAKDGKTTVQAILDRVAAYVDTNYKFVTQLAEEEYNNDMDDSDEVVDHDNCAHSDGEGVVGGDNDES